ncbi:uncharacterized protein LOC121397656 [Xenopus laevis]|uniref:Uncharacterized protein LOC121397656 n=1 Tax=Xenopus laevis TaxID=8355 RepID=A0A8J1LN91_XENLA|nr:uncharacterized protein LOC121397656 [Xenopus laevis]
MLKRIRGCVRTIQKQFRRNNKVHHLISEDNEPMNHNVPTPVHLFQVAPVVSPEARIQTQGHKEKEIQTEVAIEEIVKEEIKDCESSFSDPIQMIPNPGAIFLVVKEAEMRLEYSEEIAPAVSLPADCSELLETYESRHLDDLIVEEISSSLEMGYQAEESDATTGSVNTLKSDYSSEESDDNLDAISKDLPKDSYTRSGSVNTLQSVYSSEESYTATGSVNILQIDYSSEVSDDTLDAISEELPEQSCSTAGSVNILNMKYPSEGSEYNSDSLSKNLPEELNVSVGVHSLLHNRKANDSCLYSP